MSRVEQQIAQTFADAGVSGWLHARPLTEAPAEVALGADRPVAVASLYKLIVLVAYLHAVDRRRVAPTERLVLPARGRAGVTGVSAMRDDVELSLRDAVTSMMTVSDEAAAHAVVRRLGEDAVADVAPRLGLTSTVFRGIGRPAGPGVAEPGTVPGEVPGLDVDLDPAAYDPALATASTARDLTSLLVALWTDRTASARISAPARELMARTHGPYRLRHGFALDGIGLAHKTGSLGSLRHDVGVVRFGDGPAYAVAVLTRAARPDRVLPAVDLAIGRAARLAVDALRR